MRQMKQKSPFWIYAAILILFLTLLSMTLLPGLAARFSANTKGQDAARVAIFNISESGEGVASFTVELAPGDPSALKTVRIVSESEVTLRYTVTVHSTENLPLRYAWDGGVAQMNDASVTAVVTPGSYQKDHTLSILWHEDDNSYHYQSEVEHITVTVLAEQVD